MEAFEYTSRYDAAIFNYFAKRHGTALPPALRLAYDKVADLRYGENPYQKAALYHEPFPFAATATAEKLQGKELSYNNLIDLDAALRLATEFERPAAVVIKHTNPSGVALAATLAEAYTSAHAADSISAYGGVVGLNRPVDLATAKAMKKDVLDAVIAPDYEPAALDLLKSKKKGTFLILRTRGPFRSDHGIDMVRVLGGVLLQTTDFPTPRPEAFKVVTKVSPTPAQLRDILFGILVSRYVKSNSIVLVKGDRTVGIGAGQMSRVDACMLACHKADAAARGSVAVSDAYFPFRDGVDELAKGGVAMVAQPGGSRRSSAVWEGPRRFRAGGPESPPGKTGRAARLRRVHAPGLGVVHPRVPESHHQHPSLVAPGLSGRPRAPRSDCRGRQGLRLHDPLRRCVRGRRAHHLAEGGPRPGGRYGRLPRRSDPRAGTRLAASRGEALRRRPASRRRATRADRNPRNQDPADGLARPDRPQNKGPSRVPERPRW